jgi:asparagine synthase (glutamine-hydrolysing)
MFDMVDSIPQYYDEPMADSSQIPSMLVAELAKRDVTVALSGDGGDEFFCGYVGYMVDLFRNMQKGQMSAAECEMNERLWGDSYFRFERNHTEISKIHEKLYHPDIRGEHAKFAAWTESPIDVNKVKGLSTQKRRSYIDYKLRLSDHLLTEHGDRMFFSHSIEGRHPFLDTELIDFVRTIPDKYKLKGVNEKYILKKAGEGIVPDEILKRKKFPFQAPGMSAMIKKPSGIDFLNEDMIKKYGIFDLNYINHMKDVYSQEDFKLMGAYEIDYLLIALTVTMLCEQYSLTV